jgi:hypothetical protein
MNPKKEILLLVFSFGAFLFLACSGEKAPQSRLEVNKKYPLLSWPDSNYVAELDSILKAEPLDPNAEPEKTSLTIYSGAMPTVRLPGEKKAPREKLQTAEKNVREAPVQSGKPKGAERFATDFMNALGNLQSDPSNTSKYKVVSANDGEDLFRLLSRAYKNDASKLPRFYTLSALQSVNPNVRLEHLNAGDKVRIPVLGK